MTAAVRNSIFVAIFFFAAGLNRSAIAQPGMEPGARYVDIRFFYEPLAEYGEWIHHDTFGWVWSPYDVDPDWRPYSMGSWVWTDYGWTWMSDEPFGWATYHYGRWYFDPYYSWIWVPGTEWGPSWVAWRNGGGWIGWAPLPPQIVIRSDEIIAAAFPPHLLRRFMWCFVEEPRFCERNLRPHIARSVRNINIINMTRNVTHYAFVNHACVNKSITLDSIQKRLGRPVHTVRIADADKPVFGAGGLQGDTLRIFRPRIAAAPKNVDLTPQIKVKPRPPMAPPILKQQQERERKALEQRMTEEAAALKKRQEYERSHRPPTVPPNELKKREELERGALKEMSENQKKMLQRYQEREQKNQNGKGAPNARKFRLPPAPTTRPAVR